MNIVKRKEELPSSPQDLQRMILIGREKFNLYQRKLSLIDRTGELTQERKSLIEDGIYLGELILYAESKLGEILKDTDFLKHRLNGSIDGTIGTTSLKDLGISKADSSRFQKMNTYQHLIDVVIEECKKLEKLPTRKDFLDKIKSIEIEEHLNIHKRQSKNFNPIENLTLFNDDFRNVELESIDCIISDPPYIQEHLSIYPFFRDYAEKVLKPSGFCIFYISPQILDYVINVFSESKEMKYYWTISLYHTGSKGAYYSKSVYNQWKPILIYQKSPFKKTMVYFNDSIQGTGREKDFHPWQQSTGELSSIIDTFSDVGDTILDCFAGSGTTGIQSLKQGRKSILIEKESETFKILKGRFSSLTLP